MKRALTAILTLCIFLPGIMAADPGTAEKEAALPQNVLAVAHELDAGVFRDWTYGAYSRERRHLDCTTFISAVIDTVLHRSGRAYTPEMRRDVLIAHPDLDRDVVRKGPDTADPRYGGAAYAIEKYGAGMRIRDMSGVLPGDIIQYWKQRRDGTWFGHASLIETLRYDAAAGVYKAKIFGSHTSTDGIAVSAFELRLSGDDRVVYIARMGE
jgi:hypothetical protein